MDVKVANVVECRLKSKEKQIVLKHGSKMVKFKKDSDRIISLNVPSLGQ